VLLGCRHLRHDAFVAHEERHAPLDGLLQARAARVQHAVQMREDRLGERSGVRDVAVDARVGGRHGLGSGWTGRDMPGV
jgi:hypothetical protein